MKRASQRGVTFIELLVVLALIGILSAIAIPRLRNLRTRAQVAQIIGDFHTVRVAAYSYHAATGEYPANQGWSRVPPEFVPELPDGFVFEHPATAVQYRWRRWSLPNGTPRNRRRTDLIGMEFRGNDADLIARLRNTFDGQTTGTGTQLTVVIE